MSTEQYDKIENSKVKRYLKLIKFSPLILIPVVSFYLAGKLDDTIYEHLRPKKDPELEELCRKHEYSHGTYWVKMNTAFCYEINHNQDGSFKKEFLDYWETISRKEKVKDQSGLQ